MIIKGFFNRRKRFEHIYFSEDKKLPKRRSGNKLVFVKKKRCLIKTISKTHISEKFKKLFFF